IESQDPHKEIMIEYRSTLNSRGYSSGATTARIIEFLQERFLWEQPLWKRLGPREGRPLRIASLVESNTAFGGLIGKGAEARGNSKKFEFDIFRFPIHISSLRASYERRGMLRDQSSRIFHSAGGLDLPEEEEYQQARDVPTSMNPELAARVDDLVLVQM